MGFRSLLSVAVLLCLTSLVSADDLELALGKVQSVSRVGTVGFLLPDEIVAEHASAQVAPYEPHAGDMILYDSLNKLHHVLYRLVGTQEPLHAALVIAREDGTPALLELTGKLAITAHVAIMEVEPRLATFSGTVMVRRLRRPLTEEQSREMTRFAEAQVGKKFANGRIFLQLTPFNARSRLGRSLFGKTCFDRNRWFCSEMVVAAGTKAEVFDPRVHFANAIYPRDLAFDDLLDLSELYHPMARWVPESPQAK